MQSGSTASRVQAQVLQNFRVGHAARALLQQRNAQAMKHQGKLWKGLRISVACMSLSMTLHVQRRG